LDRQLDESNFSPATIESVRAQSNKLAAITVAEDRDGKQSIRRVIDEAFVSGFRAVMLVGAALATASAITALIFIAAPKRGVPP
jgi:hypothetical protein